MVKLFEDENFYLKRFQKFRNSITKTIFETYYFYQVLDKNTNEEYIGIYVKDGKYGYTYINKRAIYTCPENNFFIVSIQDFKEIRDNIYLNLIRSRHDVYTYDNILKKFEKNINEKLRIKIWKK